MFLRHLMQDDDNKDLDSLDENAKPSQPFLGLLLSVISALLVGGSFILQKKGLIKSTAKLSSKG